MNTFSKISLLLTACSALFLPACGTGGGENNDYYVSVQKFRGGAKGFHISGSPSAEIFASAGGLNGGNFALTPSFKDTVALGMTEDSSDDESVYTRGSMNCGGSSDVVEMGYYTSGGASGQGFLYISFQDADGPSNNVIHFMGASTTDDVKMAGLTGTAAQFWDIPDISSTLIASTQGTILKMGFNFSSGIADIRLIHGSATTAQRMQELMQDTGMTYEDALAELMAESDQVLVIRATPFYAVEG